MTHLPSYSRRDVLRFMGATGAVAALPGISPLHALAASADPLPDDAPVLVSLFLGGGHDAAHLLVPAGSYHGAYASARGGLAISEGSLLDIGSTEGGFNPVLDRLAARYTQGDMAIVRGVDLLNPVGFDPLSHFDKTDYVMMAREQPAGRPFGVFARYGETQPDNQLLLAGVEFGVPLLFNGGERGQATALPAYFDGALGVESDPYDQALITALGRVADSMDDGDTSLRAAFARMGRFGPGTSSDLAAVYPASIDDETYLERTMRVIASMINANLTGTRVYATVHGGYDTHENQRATLHKELYPELQAGIDALFDALLPERRVVLMVWSEFGRRTDSYGGGTDHGRAGSVILAGSGVSGGLYGTQPAFDDPDADGNLKGSTPFNAIYAEVLDRVLGADVSAILGTTYDPLGILTA